MRQPCVLLLVWCLVACTLPCHSQTAETPSCVEQQAVFIANLTFEVADAALAACDAPSSCLSAASDSSLNFTRAAASLQTILTACGTNATYAATRLNLRPINILAMDADYAVGLAQGYKANTGWSVDINVKYGNSDLDTYLTQLQQGNGTAIAKYDGFIFRSDRVAAMVSAGVLLPLADIKSNDTGKEFKWQDIYLNLRQSTSRYGGKIVAVPLGIWPFMMYVRRDWMAEGQKLLGEPTSWGADNMLTHEGVLRIAEALQRRNYDFSVAPNGYRNDTFTPNKRPICFHVSRPFYDSSPSNPTIDTAFLMHLLGTFTQTAGPSQGWLLDRLTAEPFVDTVAMRAALRLWLRYMAVSVIQPDDVAGAMSCAVIFSSMEVFKNLTSYDTYVRGQLHFMAMPGSTTFYNRNTRALEACAPDKCSSSTQLVADNTTVYYNMVGGSATRRAYLLGINKLAPPAYQLQMWDFATYLSQQTFELSWRRDSDIDPIRVSDLSNEAAFTDSSTQPNWTPDEWEQWRNVTEDSILTYTNYMEDPRMMDNTAYVSALHFYSQKLYAQTIGDDNIVTTSSTSSTSSSTSSTSSASGSASSSSGVSSTSSSNPGGRHLHGSLEWVEGAQAQSVELEEAGHLAGQRRKLFQEPDGQVTTTAYDALIDSTMTGLYNSFVASNNNESAAAVQAEYRQSLNYELPKPRPSPPPPPPPSPGPSSSNWFESLSESQQIAIIATPTAVGVTLLVLAVVTLIGARRSQHKGLISGAILAPGAGPDTSLLITDIESRTTFWEVLPSEVMDESIALHHLVMRSCARKHRCYESATEGDSFLLSAHSPADALRCALDVQRALMEAPWPAALLAQPLCMPRYASTANLPAGVRNLMGFNTGQGLLKAPSSRVEGSWCSWLWDKCRRGDRGGGGGEGGKTQAVPHSTQLFSPTPVMAPAEEAALAGNLPTHAPVPTLLSSYPLHAQLKLGLVRAVLTTYSHTSGRGSEPTTPTNTRRRSLLGLQALGQGGDLAGPPGSVLILRGLRVRMGIHTGVTQSSEVAFNKTAGRMQYSGEFLTLAKLIQDAAQGGQVLATAGCFGQLPKEQMQSEVVLGHMGNHVLKEGYAPTPVYSALNHPVLMLRAGLLGPVRTVKQVSAGIMQAPTGCASICFMYALSVSALMSWNPEVAQQAVATYQQIAQGLLWQMGGYAVEVAEGLILAALGSPTAALHWATATIEACLNADWPAELLEHQLGEEISVTTLAPVGSTNINGSFTLSPATGVGGGVLVGLAGGDGVPVMAANVAGSSKAAALRSSARARRMSDVSEAYYMLAAGTGEQAIEGGGEEEEVGPSRVEGLGPRVGKGPRGRRMSAVEVRRSSWCADGRRVSQVVSYETPYRALRLLRGLRLKCGIDLGALSVSLNETTGHMQYKGKVMNRSARIGSVAKTGQVWCSEAVWQAHLDEDSQATHSGHTDNEMAALAGAAYAAASTLTPAAATATATAPAAATAATTAVAATTAPAAGPAADGCTADVSQPPFMPGQAAGGGPAPRPPAACAAGPGVDDSDAGAAARGYGRNCGPNGEDLVLAGVPLGPHKLKGIVDEMHLVQVRRLVLDSM